MNIPGSKGPTNAKIMIVGEAYGADEARQNKPFVGASGKELDRMLREAGIDPEKCFFTNVVNKRPNKNDMKDFCFKTTPAKKAGVTCVRGLYPDTPLLEGILELEKAINLVQPECIVALGNYSCWALTDDGYKLGNSEGYKVPTGITSFRGSQLRSRFNNIPVLPTYHPAAILRKWDWRNVAVNDLRSRVPLALRGEWDEPPRNFIIRPSLDQVMEYLYDILLRAENSPYPILVACDIETVQRCVECVGLAISSADAICIPIMHNDMDHYWQPQDEIVVWQTLKKVLEHPKVEIVGQNFVYDYQYFWWFYGIQANYKQDTMLAQHCAFPGTPMGLDYISSLYCWYHRYWKDDGKVAAKEHNDEQRWVYNCRDVVVTFEAIQELWKVLNYFDLMPQYGFQMLRARSAIKMMLKGVAVDKLQRKEQKLIQTEAAMQLEGKLIEMMPESVWKQPAKKAAWYSSPQQLCQIFYEELGIAPVRNRQTGGLTVDDDALNKIAAREPALAQLCATLQKLRSLKVFGDFIDMKVSPGDGRMRASFSPTTETFRYRSSESALGGGRNLQNIPKGVEELDG